ncbi:hypothetical protein B0H67DRAFT_578244 [Lasiosphaeris hirsuta]|uniref:Uncharacterized protein n=1 Tax=Lasiosphaeris hirsuta TaxID=260670 RepID=A0AA40ASH4_9PEZI|nr:hypothetical protein B0H67DRAFT_578244 [Lasiosphaeris hirsuta]
MSASASRAPGGLRCLDPISDTAVGKQPLAGVTTTAVIFVHGLGAGPNRTWVNGDTCWITDFLLDDLKVEGLWLFGAAVRVRL